MVVLAHCALVAGQMGPVPVGNTVVGGGVPSGDRHGISANTGIVQPHELKRPCGHSVLVNVPVTRSPAFDPRDDRLTMQLPGTTIMEAPSFPSGAGQFSRSCSVAVKGFPPAANSNWMRQGFVSESENLIPQKLKPGGYGGLVPMAVPAAEKLPYATRAGPPPGAFR
jgi:hypothetical protein